MTLSARMRSPGRALHVCDAGTGVRDAALAFVDALVEAPHRDDPRRQRQVADCKSLLTPAQQEVWGELTLQGLMKAEKARAGDK